MDGGDLIALEKDRGPDGSVGLLLSAGPFVQALEFATGKQRQLWENPQKRSLNLHSAIWAFVPIR